MAETPVQLARKVLAMVGPVTMSYAVDGLATILPIMVCSRVSSGNSELVTQQIAAVGLGNVALTFLALAIGSGWTGGQDTVVTQAFGRKDFILARSHLHQCQVWMLIISAISSIMLLRVEAFLGLFGQQNSELNSLIAEYAAALIPSVWFQHQYDTLRKFLMNQQLPTPPLVANLLSVPLYAVACFVLTSSGMSMMTALGYAEAMRAIPCFVLLATYTTVRCPHPSCDGWWKPWLSKDLIADGLMAYARVGLPSTMMVSVDWLSCEVLTILAGWISDGPELAAHVAAAHASEYLFYVVRGGPKAATALVGAAYGDGNLAGVWRAFTACLVFAASLSGLLGLGIMVGRETCVSWFLKDAGTTRDILKSMVPLLVMQMVVDAVNSLLQGAHAGLGNFSEVTLGFVLTCWFVQLPLAYHLAITLDWGVRGLRLACLAGVTLDLLYNVLLMRWCLQPDRFKRGLAARHRLASVGGSGLDDVVPVPEYAVLRAQQAMP